MRMAFAGVEANFGLTSTKTVHMVLQLSPERTLRTWLKLH
jgi:hypothetical protein